MRSDLVLMPKMKIHPDKIIVYNEVHWEPCKPTKRIDEVTGEIKPGKADHLQSYSRTAEGQISKIARKKIERALDYFLIQATEKTELNRLSGKYVKFKLAFITLTLPSIQIHSDNEIKSKCLNSFIIELTKFYRIKNYIWRAEKQKNGNLHFHIIVDKFVPWNELRDRWNRIVNKLGYVDRYRDEMKEFHKGGFHVRQKLLEKWDYKSQVKAYKQGKANDFQSPNSTDVHSVRNVHNIKKYVGKYMTKNDTPTKLNENATTEFQKQQGRVWSCNQSLSNITGAIIDVDRESESELTTAITNSKCKRYDETYFSVFYIDISTLLKSGAINLFKYFSDYMIDVFNFHMQLST